MANNLDNIIEIIRQLTNKTVDNGCTEKEALSAMNKVNELLTKYNLSLTQVFVDKTDCITKDILTDRQNRNPIDYCLMSLASFCDCKIYSEKRKYITYKVFGMPQDVSLYEYLYTVIKNAISNETLSFQLSDLYHQVIISTFVAL